MDLLGFVADLTWWQWALVVVGLVVYIAIWAFVFAFLQDNVSEWAALVWAFSIGLPVSVVVLVCYSSFLVGGWPWKWIQRARFHGTFDFWPPNEGEADQVQKVVDRRLGEFAFDMDRAFSAQHDARRKRERGTPVNLDDVDAEVKRAKRIFWRAHGLARKFHIPVHDIYDAYLTAAQ